MKEIDDADMTRLLERAEDGVVVDAPTKAVARARTLAVYRAASDGRSVAADRDHITEHAAVDLVRHATPGPRPWRRRLVTIAAVSVIAVAGAFVWQLADRRQTPAPADRLPTPVASTTSVTTTRSTVTEAPTVGSTSALEGPAAASAARALGDRFMSARAAYDADALLDLLARHATFADGELARSRDEYELQSEWERIVGWRFLDPVCTANTAERVVCTYRVHDKFNQAAGKGPFPGNGFLLGIEGDRITSVSHVLTTDLDFFAENEVQFYAWLRQNHPDDLASMLDGDRLMGGPNRSFVALNDESLRLWERHTAEYLEDISDAD